MPEPTHLAVPIALAQALDALLSSDPRVQLLFALRACQPMAETPDAPAPPQDAPQ